MSLADHVQATDIVARLRAALPENEELTTLAALLAKLAPDPMRSAARPVAKETQARRPLELAHDVSANWAAWHSA